MLVVDFLVVYSRNLFFFTDFLKTAGVKRGAIAFHVLFLHTLHTFKTARVYDIFNTFKTVGNMNIFVLIFRAIFAVFCVMVGIVWMNLGVVYMVMTIWCWVFFNIIKSHIIMLTLLSIGDNVIVTWFYSYFNLI